MMKIINDIPGVPGLAAKGHYCIAAENDGVIYVSGQLALDPQTGETVCGTAAEETGLILNNIKLILAALGCTEKSIIKTTAYIPSPECWPEVNAVYASFFGDHKPSRMIVPGVKLNYGLKVEIDCVAIMDDGES